MAGRGHRSNRRGQAPLTAALIGGIAAWNVAQNRVVPRRWYAAVNAVGCGVALGVGRLLGLRLDELGIGEGWVRRGVRVALPPAAVIAAAGAAAAAHPFTTPLLRDDRVVPSELRTLAAEALVRIPIGTALFEELVFRGLLLGWFARSRGLPRSIVVSNALFGLWHVLPSDETARVYREGVLQRSSTRRAGFVLGSVVITGLAGSVLARLRLRADSLAAPIVVHAVLNVVGYAAAWTEARSRLGRPPQVVASSSV